MKEYLMLFWNEAGQGGYAITPEEMQAAAQHWQAWIGSIAMQGKLVATKPIQYEGVVVSNAGSQEQPAIKDGELVTGFLICKAESQAEVEEWGRSCPILQAPRGSVEIRECSPFQM
jgi:hypothetical protein